MLTLGEIKLDNLYDVFDGQEWSKVGHDVGDNSCFYHPARVIGIYYKDDLPVIDVIFVHNNKRSNGHFPFGIRPHVYSNPPSPQN